MKHPFVAAGMLVLQTTSSAYAGTVLGYSLSNGLPNTELGSFSTSFSTTTSLAAINNTLWGFAEPPIPPVPLPAGAWLLLSALGGLGFAGWRRKKAVAA